MRLISARIRGFGRLVDTKINLDAKVIAVVGPNEAGKTTLLRALAHVDTEDAVPYPQRSRAAEITDDTRVTEFSYMLDDEDREALMDLDLQEQPTRATISRTASGTNLTVGLTPKPIKSVRDLLEVLPHLNEALVSADLDDRIDSETVYADPNSDGARDYRAELGSVIESVQAAVDDPGTEVPSEAIERAAALRSATVDDQENVELRKALQAIQSWSERPDPAQECRTRIWNRSPDFVTFDEEARSIQSTYTFNEDLVANVPAALENLAGTAGLDLEQLLANVRAGDIPRRRTSILQANQRMDRIFEEAWKQSRLAVHFEVDGDQLRIELLENDDTITVFDERSSGLRMFVALVAFLRVHGSERPPILLIDEAENHLHIDAQADLVDMFVTQRQAIKVIYTTHSPACLPPDLGTGIRTVVPRKDNFQISDVKNSFWQGAAGYSPLMLAMGAAAAAFTPARHVVLAEGATEMIMLPTLLRAATELPALPYQVAPGLSEVPKDFLPQLDLEAAKVAYLVDGDDGGRSLKVVLVEAGIPDDLIAELAVPGLENLLEPQSFSDAFAALLPECNPDIGEDGFPAVPGLEPAADGSWAVQAASWAKAQSLTMPSKVAIANWLVENGRAVPSPAGKSALLSAHQKLVEALKL